MLIDESMTVREVFDGTTFTFIVGEDSQFPDGEWINGRNIFDQAYAVNGASAINDIRSDHPGGANGVMCGGSVHFLTEDMDL